nr:metacaspase-1 isoform X1 [Ipomoea trifida]
MRDLLVEHYSFQPASILILAVQSNIRERNMYLAEEEPYRAPTRKNILEGFKWLMKNLLPGDSLGGSWADRRWLGEAALAGRGCGSWAGLRWLSVAAMPGRGGAGEADVRSGEARWRCVGEARWTCGGGGAAVEVRRPVAVRGWKSGRGCEGCCPREALFEEEERK